MPAIASLLGLCFMLMLRSSFGLLEFELVCLANKIAELSEVLKIGEAVRVRRIHGAVSRSEEPVHGMPADVEAGLRVAHRLQFLRPPHVWPRLTSRSVLTRWRGLTGASARVR